MIYEHYARLTSQGVQHGDFTDGLQPIHQAVYAVQQGLTSVNNHCAHDFAPKLPNILIRLTLLATERSQMMLVQNNKAHFS